MNDFKYFCPASPKESYQKALDLASKAVALDPSLGECAWGAGQRFALGQKTRSSAGSI